MDIRILPSNIANMIAAGEVVQRPASVVKELMENSIDAGADQVTVILKNAGSTLIQVIDNGKGMTPDEAVVCFERHATSKIATAEDLESITTFGFRGEALASIAAVAEVTLRTRRPEDETGCQVEFADSKHISTTECAAPAGTSMSVRNLFYNVPARRKFLKSENVEFRHILDEFKHIALTRPDVAFTLIHNDKEVHVLKKTSSMKFRIKDLLGNNTVSKIVDISADTSVVSINGYICRPDLAKKTLGEQFFFVNGRYFRSPYLHKAVMKGYEDMIADGATPSYFIYLTADPHTIDVNISPTKTEVKFEDESVVFQVLYACLRESLGRNSFGASIDFDKTDMPELPVFSKKYSDYRPDVIQPNVEFDRSYNPFDIFEGGGGFSGEALNPFEDNQSNFIPDFPKMDIPQTPRPAGSGQAVHGGAGFSSYVNKTEDYGKLFEDKTLPTTSVIVLQGKYILTQVQSGMLVINIRRAKERIFFERFLNVLTKNESVAQAALFPVQITVGIENLLIFSENSELLQRLGFDISPFGNDTIVVNGLPDGFKNDAQSVEALMADILITLNDGAPALAGMMESMMAGKFAALASKGGSPVSSPIEAQRLIDTLFSCDNSEFTSKGLRIMSIITMDEFDKRF